MIKSSKFPSSLKDVIRKEVRSFLNEEDLFDDSQSSSKESSKDKQVSLSKVSGIASGTKVEDQTEEITLENVIEKLNTIRSGRSFKDDQVLAQMEKYYGDLKDAEKKALQAFLSGISQIVTGGADASSATDPSDPPNNVKMVDKKDVKTRQIKPNIIKKGADGGSSSPPAENIAPPVNVKTR